MMIQSVLILDDSPSARLDLRMKVNKVASPETIYEASSYEKAVEIMLQEKVDVALVDLSMPKKNGMDFIVDFIKSNQSAVETPIIVTTSVDENSLLRKALEGMVLSCLTKPIKIELLENVLVDLM